MSKKIGNDKVELAGVTMKNISAAAVNFFTTPPNTTLTQKEGEKHTQHTDN